MTATSSASADGHMASIIVNVVDYGGLKAPVGNARIELYRVTAASTQIGADDLEPASYHEPVRVQYTNEHGRTTFTGLDEGEYCVFYRNEPATPGRPVTVRAHCVETVCLEPMINADFTTELRTADCGEVLCRPPVQGDNVLQIVRLAKVPATIVASHGLSLLRRSDTEFTYAAMLHSAVPYDHIVSILLAQRPSARFAGSPAATTGAPVPATPMIATAVPVGTGAVPTGAVVPPTGVLPAGAPPIAATPGGPAMMIFRNQNSVAAKAPIPISGNVGVSLTRTETEQTPDIAFWVAIRNSTDALSFNNYLQFIDILFCKQNGNGNGFAGARSRYNELHKRRFLPFTDTDSYRVLKAATEAFVMVNCGVLSLPKGFTDGGYLDRRDLPLITDLPGELQQYFESIGAARVLPYLALILRKLPDIPIVSLRNDEHANLCVGFIQEKLESPCLIELIWSYWNEEGMLVQTLNTITRRFQNVRSPVTPDPLANLEIDPLRPLNNLIWGYTQDEQHRLTVNRRNLEYDHHYGLRLHGRAIEQFRPADTRSQFLEAFHHLLRLCTTFFKQDDDTTVKADAFPVLNALKEVHLVMSEGAHNQFGDLPSTARIEMLMQQWLLARPEFREFLPTRLMVAYPEPWMDRVDAMKKLQGWTDTSVVHFRNLAIFGEQLLLSIRYGAWSEVFEPTQAFNWARFWRPQLQGYIHAYRSATGVDLSGDTADVAGDAMLPSLLLARRLSSQRRIA